MDRSSDASQCPVCGEPYDRQIIVERGDRWDDLFPGSPFAFFKRYRRRCTARYDDEAETELTDSERAIYFHDRVQSATVY